MLPRIAIATTLKHTGPVILTFIKYHESIGFNHFFFFFDDPNDDTIDLVKNKANVTVIKNDYELRELWKDTYIYKLKSLDNSFANDYCNELIGKQVLNLSVAIQLALQNNIDWILHIDVDELFYCPDMTVNEHFALLDGYQITKMSYVNHEAIPESTHITDYFKEVSLFKYNLNVLDDTKKSKLKQSIIFENRGYFNYYANGKSAARVTKDLSPNGPHLFEGQSSFDMITSPCILHFPICGLNFFLDKYRILGDFSEYWFGSIRIEDVLPFHIKAKRVVNNLDADSIEEFYKDNVLIEADLAKKLLKEEVLFRLNKFVL